MFRTRLIGEHGALPPTTDRVVVHMGSGDCFTIWMPIRRFMRVWRRARRRGRFLHLEGSRRIGLNPRQVTYVEGRRGI
jgi:hypothetical protein